MIVMLGGVCSCRVAPPERSAVAGEERGNLSQTDAFQEALWVMGKINPNTFDAAAFYASSVFGCTNSPAWQRFDDGEYAKGDASTVQRSNRCLEQYFSLQQGKNAEFATDWRRLIERAAKLDLIDPIPFGSLATGGRPAADYLSKYDFYDFALNSLTRGNVFRAVTLVASEGHDDVLQTSCGSRLYAAGSLGPVAIPSPEMRHRFKEAGDALYKARMSGLVEPVNNGNGDQESDAAAYQYQTIAGFYMGCQLAKMNLPPVSYNPTIIDAIVEAATRQMPASASAFKQYVSSHYAQGRLWGLLPGKYVFDLPVVLPGMGGFLYKLITLDKWLTMYDDTGALFRAGYHEAFRADFPPPAGWSDTRFRAAKVQLDYFLAHIEFVMESHRVGSILGAKVCRAYKSDLASRLGITDPDERLIFDMGFMHHEQTWEQFIARRTLGQQYSHIKSVERLRPAFTRLIRKLETPQARALLDYGPMPYPTNKSLAKMRLPI
jgi:hypothetical protein